MECAASDRTGIDSLERRDSFPRIRSDRGVTDGRQKATEKPVHALDLDELMREAEPEVILQRWRKLRTPSWCEECPPP